MIWQDWIFSIGSWIFIIGFIPSFLKKQYTAVGTSILTGGVLLVFTVTYLTLGLPMAAVSNFLTSSCWFAMAVLKSRSPSPSK
jgi:hypothetical protein